MSKKKKTLVLLDAHAIIHRAYHGMPDFATRAGFPTGAIYGFAMMVLKIIDEFQPEYIVACYDLPGATFRHETYADYKGGRAKTEDALKMQFAVTREICEIFAIPMYDSPGFEADDMLGTIVEQTKDNKDLDILIASGDMDTLQLVDKDRVRVYTLKKGINDTIVYNEEAVRERYGFDPVQLIDYKGLRGDPSDNIPGIKGIGDKAATIAISNFGTIENVYEVLQQDEQKLVDAGLTKRMVGLIRDGREDADFSKVIATIRRDAPIEFELPNGDWKSQVNVEDALEVFEKYELRSLPQKLHASLGLAQMVQEPEQSVEEVDESILHEEAIKLWILDSEQTNADLTMILDETGVKTFADAQAKINTDLGADPESQNVWEHIEKPLIPIIKNMQKNGVLIDQDFFKKLSLEYHKELDVLEKEIFAMAGGEEFNIKSPKQLGEVLFDRMGLPTKGVKKSKTGSWSTNVKVLEKLAEEHEIVVKVMHYREFQKLVSTYIDVIPDMVGDDGRLHAEFLQNGTTTGRFSSRNPNMQNIPTRTDLGRRIREGFIAAPGYELVSLDYSQIELRILAILSGDPVLIDIFKEGRDIHSAVAALIGGVDENNVDREMRRKAKIVNFGILYGMGVNSLKKAMETDRAEAQQFHDGFFTQFPKATEFLESSKSYAHEHSYTKTLFGRRRQFRNINSKLPFIRAMAERMALNAPIQGTAADLMKLAMIQADQYITDKNHKDDARLILQIHDEIIFEVKSEIAADFAQDIDDIMEKVFENSYLKYESPIPIIVHSSKGSHWGELK